MQVEVAAMLLLIVLFWNCFSFPCYCVQRRNCLNHVKHIRDAVRFENTRLRQQSGLLGREALLYDFEEKQDKV